VSNVDKDIRYAVTAEDRFSRTFRQLKTDIGSSRDQMGGLVSVAGKVNLALGALTLGAVGAGGLALGIRQLANDLDKLNDAADATGSTVENLSALEDVARRNGQTLDTVASAVVKFNKALNDAKPGSATEQALDRLGLSAKDLREADPSEALFRFAKSLAGFADDGDKARLVLELTGKSIKDLAPFLKDVGELGSLNAKVTTEQAQAAERFNKELFALQTNASNAARSLVADLIPAVNRLFEAKRDGSLTKLLGFDDLGGGLAQANRVYQALSLARERITPLSILEKDPTNERALAELARIEKAAKALGETFKAANHQRLNLMDTGAGAGRGSVNPPLVRPGLGAPPPAATAAGAGPQVTEAMRYLEQLQKQAEKLQELTVLQQLLRDIEAKRIDGITPKLEAELKLAARRVDLQKKLNDEKEREKGFQSLLSTKDQRDLDEVQRLLEQTTTGRLQGLENQADKLLEFSRRIGEDDPRQRQLVEAMQQLKKQAQDIITPVDVAQTAFDKLADTIEKSMDRGTSAILDFVVDGKGGMGDLFASFQRDVLRALIEDPVRDAMKSVVASIRTTFSDAAKQGNPLQLLFQSIGGGGSGGGLGDLFSSIGGFFGFTGRAGGGAVNKGDLVRWQENGREWFVPGADGAVVNQAQMQGLAGGTGSVVQHNSFTITGGDPADTQRQINDALARNNAMLLRSMRTGGAFAQG
jgi:hypothetical protein